MELNLPHLYRNSSAWMADKVGGATDLAAATPCDDWTVRDLLNHLLDTQRFFLGKARGEDVAPPAANPPDLLSSNPRRDIERVQAELLDEFTKEGVIEKTGPFFSIAFADQLLHGWDLARATGQDDTMPPGLAESAYAILRKMLTPEQRGGGFKPEIPVGDDATPQQRLLAFTGRDPA
jgi:uncharacterized protein (TIGR03086 family)